MSIEPAANHPKDRVASRTIQMSPAHQRAQSELFCFQYKSVNTRSLKRICLHPHSNEALQMQ